MADASERGGYWKYDYQATMPSIYQNSLLKNQQDNTGRYVFLHPSDGKPVCTQCSGAAAKALDEQRRQDPTYQQKSWRDSNQELFGKWEKLLQEDRAPDAESKDKTVAETT